VKSKDFLSIADLSAEGIRMLISKALVMKTEGWTNRLSNKVLVLMFEKPSTRTRVSFEVAMRQMGGHCLYLSPEEVGLGKRESAPDVARVLSRYANVIAARTFSHQTLEMLAEYAEIPVINALSDVEHPCQALADMLTMYEHKTTLPGLNVAYVGDGNNTAHSLMLASALCGANFLIASPHGYEVKDKILAKARQLAKENGSKIVCTVDPRRAATDADVVYTDVWTSMGQEAEAVVRRRVFASYQVDAGLLALAKKDAILMHPLPAHHGEEVAEGILYTTQSVVFDQAENRMHAQKALLAAMLGGQEITTM
jgi:ornithine carbamoyltransferase